MNNNNYANKKSRCPSRTEEMANRTTEACHIVIMFGFR